MLPYQSISPRDKHLRLSWEQAAAAASVKEVHSRVSRCPEVEARALTLARVAALEIMTSVLFARTQAAGALFARPSSSAVHASTKAPMCAYESSHINCHMHE